MLSEISDRDKYCDFSYICNLNLSINATNSEKEVRPRGCRMGEGELEEGSQKL